MPKEAKFCIVPYPPQGLLAIGRRDMEISEELIKRMQELGRKHGKDMSRQEAYEAGSNLVGFFKILLDVDMRLHPENYKRKKTE